MICAPDAGRVKLADRYAQHLGADLAFVQKRRDTKGDGGVEAFEMVGEVEGRHCVLIDDMIDTAGTITAAAELLAKRGATEVWVAATHLVLSDPATERLKNSSISRLVGTNTHPAAARAPARRYRAAVGGAADRRGHQRHLRGPVGLGDLRRRKPVLKRHFWLVTGRACRSLGSHFLGF